MPTIKITESLRTEKLRRVDGALVPSVTRDSEVPGFALHVTRKRSFWALSYQPKGVNPASGRRWGGGVRHELGDAMLMTVAEARTASLAAKALVRQGRSPHHEAMAASASAVAERSVLPATVAGALDAYQKALMARRQPSEATRRQTVAYARKAVRLMKAEILAACRDRHQRRPPAGGRLAGSAGERRHIFGGLNRLLAWCRRQRLIEHNPCDDLDRDERPKPGRARDNVPSIEVLRAVWAAVENEPQRDLVRLLILLPLRRTEGGALRWSEVDLERRRIRNWRGAHEERKNPRASAG